MADQSIVLSVGEDAAEVGARTDLQAKPRRLGSNNGLDGNSSLEACQNDVGLSDLSMWSNCDSPLSLEV